MSAFPPSAPVLPLASKRFGGSQGAPAGDAFRDLFQGRLAARLASGEAVSAASGLKACRRGKAASGSAGSAAGGEGPTSATTRPRSTRTRKTPTGGDSQPTTLGLGETSRTSLKATGTTGGGSAAGEMPPRLKGLTDFLKTLPDQTLKVPSGQAPAVAAFLLQAGLPQEEVDRLLLAPGAQERGLSAADLTAAWQRTQGLASWTEGQANRLGDTAKTASQNQEILPEPGAQRLWEHRSLPGELLPILRLALSRLGASPEDLASLDEEAGSGGVPLARVWEILQKCRNLSPLGTSAASTSPPQGEVLHASELLGQRPVTGAEIEEWRQVLLGAGLKPQEVEELLGRVTPTSQEDLKATLLSLAPPETSQSALTEAKPLYLPESLRLGVFRPGSSGEEKSQTGGGGRGDQRHQGASFQGVGLAGSWALEGGGEGLNFTPMQNTAQSLPQMPAGTGATSLLNTSTWRPLTPEVREALWSQVQTGIMTNLRPGESQIKLSLNPPELGEIQLTLRLTGQEVAVTAMAGRPEVAALATQGVNQLLQTLAQQGLVLTQFQVQVKEDQRLPAPSAFAGTREKGTGTGAKRSTTPRFRTGEVDRFA